MCGPPNGKYFKFEYHDGTGDAPLFFIDNMTLQYTAKGWNDKKKREERRDFTKSSSSGAKEKPVPDAPMSEQKSVTVTLEVPEGSKSEAATKAEQYEAENHDFLVAIIGRVQELILENRSELFSREDLQTEEIITMFSSPLLYKKNGPTWQFRLQREYGKLPVRRGSPPVACEL